MFRRLLTATVTFFQSFFLQESQLSLAQKWVLGLVNLAAVVLFWVLSSFLVNDLFETKIYRKPFFITWINTSCFTLFLIPYMKYERLSVNDFIAVIRRSWNQQRYTRLRDQELLPETPNEYGLLMEQLSTAEPPPEVVKPADEEVPMIETIKLSLQFIVLWFLANLVTNSSLSYTSVASQTILSSTSSFFTLIVGHFYLVETINRNKIIGILLSFAGVLIVTKIDASDSNQTPTASSPMLILWGNFLALAGALIYGVYTILLKKKITVPDKRKERILNTHLFFGFVGLYCLVFLWPLIIILHFTGLEEFEVPKGLYVLALLGANAFITFISDFCWCKAVLLTSPLTVTVGLSLTIPLAMVGDWFIRGFHVNAWYIFGAAVVTVGFMVINRDEKEEFVGEDPEESS
ncbi:hypothetical protein C7M61_001739 [Candidozyma pseudohaemuli]|uniref:EamA domain-containing protein n=1 Tax=Candidozyma pseudohaemuli TaxID=418784 RepID=A0A2P7YVD1_9ASCO|nr:hypothetical protein C7M61_001739 [[Candida] pseudohaemulonii]PSK39928.1 hypothetical protein C7M61_001739 [[Candida] pseudohaemulonii]